MDDGRRCLQCGGSLEGRRSDALFDRQKCKRKYYRKRDRSYNIDYTEPPPGNSIGQDRADREFKRQFANEVARSEDLTEVEIREKDHQRRNRGTMTPYFRNLFLRRADDELADREAAVRDPRALRVEDPHDRTTIGSLAERGRASRARNRPVDPLMHQLRPGPEPFDPYSSQEAEVSDAPPGWRRGRR